MRKIIVVALLLLVATPVWATCPLPPITAEAGSPMWTMYFACQEQERKAGSEVNDRDHQIQMLQLQTLRLQRRLDELERVCPAARR